MNMKSELNSLRFLVPIVIRSHMKSIPRFQSIAAAMQSRLPGVRVASTGDSVPAFDGVLYGAAALCQDVNLVDGVFKA